MSNLKSKSVPKDLPSTRRPQKQCSQSGVSIGPLVNAQKLTKPLGGTNNCIRENFFANKSSSQLNLRGVIIRKDASLSANNENILKLPVAESSIKPKTLTKGLKNHIIEMDSMDISSFKQKKFLTHKPLHYGIIGLQQTNGQIIDNITSKEVKAEKTVIYKKRLHNLGHLMPEHQVNKNSKSYKLGEMNYNKLNYKSYYEKLKDSSNRVSNLHKNKEKDCKLNVPKFPANLLSTQSTTQHKKENVKPFEDDEKEVFCLPKIDGSKAKIAQSLYSKLEKLELLASLKEPKDCRKISKETQTIENSKRTSEKHLEGGILIQSKLKDSKEDNDPEKRCPDSVKFLINFNSNEQSEKSSQNSCISLKAACESKIIGIENFDREVPRRAGNTIKEYVTDLKKNTSNRFSDLRSQIGQILLSENEFPDTIETKYSDLKDIFKSSSLRSIQKDQCFEEYLNHYVSLLISDEYEKIKQECL